MADLGWFHTRHWLPQEAPGNPPQASYSQGLLVAADAKHQDDMNRNKNLGQSLTHNTYLTAKLETIA